MGVIIYFIPPLAKFLNTPLHKGVLSFLNIENEFGGKKRAGGAAREM